MALMPLVLIGSVANIISGIILGLVVAEMFTFIVRRNWVIRLPDSVPPSVSRSFSALIPGFIILSIMELCRKRY